jgi:arginase
MNPDGATMIKGIRIIGAASGHGARDQGCRRGPRAFRRSSAWAQLARHPLLAWMATLAASETSAPDPDPVACIADLCRRLALPIGRSLAAANLPLILGGDHSIAIGTWSAVARFVGAPLGLLWIDAHLDSHTPQTSPSGAIHGMPLACLLGRGDPRLLDLGIPGAQIDPRHTVVLGPRSWEAEEAAFLASQGVRVIGAGEIGKRGLADCFAEAQAIVAGASHGFGVTLDLDAFDPSLAPGVGTPEPHGLDAGELRGCLRWLTACSGLRAVEIVEYNPRRDHHGLTAQLIGDIIGDLLPPRCLDAPSGN